MLLIEQFCYELLLSYYFGLEVLLSYLLKLKYALVIYRTNGASVHKFSRNLGGT